MYNLYRATFLSLCMLMIVLAYMFFSRGYIEMRKNWALLQLSHGLIHWSPSEQPREDSWLISVFENLGHTASDQENVTYGWRTGDAYLISGKEQAAVEEWNKVASSSRLLRQRALSAKDEQKLQVAVGWLSLASQVDPADGWAWFHLGRVFAEQERQNDEVEALVQAQTAAAQRQDSSLALTLALYRLDRFGKSERPTALRLIQDALEYDRFASQQERMDAYYWAASIFTVQQEYESAYEYASMLMQHDPTNYEALVLMGRLTWRVDNSQEALTRSEAYLQKAVASRPNFIWSHFWLADFYAETQQLDKARSVFEQILTIDPNNQRAREFMQNDQ